MTSDGEALALHQALRFAPRGARVELEVLSARHPQLVVRRTRYEGVVVEERILTRAFSWVEPPSAVQALVLMEGSFRLGRAGERAPLMLEPGEVLLLAPSEASRSRAENATFFDVEWTPTTPVGELPRVVGRVALDEVKRLGEALASGRTDRALFQEVVSSMTRAGAPFEGFSVDALTGGPSERDLKIARAISAQLADLRTSASSQSLGDLAELSPRQLQRVLADFSQRYRVNGTNWRDLRNRYRVQVGIVLLSVPELSVSAIAEEVGYTSGAAFARALANLDLPPPAALREEIARLASVP